jgi:tetratricopeptide (TPR) repeat protein
MKSKLARIFLALCISQIFVALACGNPLKDLVEQAGVAMTNGNYTQAVKCYSEVIKINPKFEQIYTARGNAYLLLDKWDEAIGDLSEAIRLNHTNYLAYELRAAVYYQNQKFDQAISDFSSALQAEPDSRHAFQKLRGRALKLRGMSYYWKNSFDKAVEDLTQALKLLPDDADIFQKRGISYYRLDEADHALSDFNKAIQLAPNDYMSLYGRGTIYSETDLFPDAIKDLERVISLIPESPGANNLLAWIFATCPDDKLRNGERAVQLAKKACEFSKWKKYVYVDTLAAAYAETGDYENAIKYQKQAAGMEGIPESKRTNIQNRVGLYLQHKPYREPNVRDHSKENPALSPASSPQREAKP